MCTLARSWQGGYNSELRTKTECPLPVMPYHLPWRRSSASSYDLNPNFMRDRWKLVLRVSSAYVVGS